MLAREVAVKERSGVAFGIALFVAVMGAGVVGFFEGARWQAVSDRDRGFMPEWKPFDGTNCASYVGHVAYCPQGQHAVTLQSGVEVCEQDYGALTLQNSGVTNDVTRYSSISTPDTLFTITADDRLVIGGVP